jgi:PAS domain S-box-containing protein
MQEDFKKINLELDRKNRELEESLDRQEEIQTYLSSILESMNNGVIGVDAFGKLTQFNRAAAEITGYTSTEVLGKNYRDVFGDTLSEKNVLSVMDTGQGYVRDEKVIWNKKGKPVSLSFQSGLLKDQKNNRLGAVEIFSDISRIKALEEEMQQNQTMAALGSMAATVAHEIRNPLGAMGVWAGLLDRDLEREDPRRETLSKIIDALGRLNRIVSNLLLYSRPIKAQFRKVPLQEVLGEAVNYIDLEVERLGKQITIQRTWDDAAPIYVHADPEKLQQIIMNLCLNSVQAMTAGGTLSVICGESRKETKDFAYFSIVDTGIGIEKERIDRIFDPFHTTKENGTGLGLAIVKKYVDYHAGFINVKSKVHVGTTIRVFLPKARN